MDRAIELYPEANDTKALQGLIKLPSFILLKPHETKTFPLKYISDRQTISEARQEFSIMLNSDDSSLNIQPGRVFFYKTGCSGTTIDSA